MKNNHIRTRRLAALGLVATLLLGTLMCHDVSAAYPVPMQPDNDTSLTGDMITLLDIDWEQETVGTRPDMAWIPNYKVAGPHPDVEVVDAGDDHGHVLQWTQIGQMDRHYGIFAIGHVLNCKFTYSLDFRFLTASSDVQVGFPLIGSNDGVVPSSHVNDHADNVLFSSGYVRYGGVDYVHDTSKWTNFMVEFDMPNRVAMAYLDGVLIHEKAILNDNVPIYWEMYMMETVSPSASYVWQVDNMYIGIPEHEVQQLPSHDPDAKTKLSITFDNGRQSVYDVAYPLLESYGYKATVGVTIDYVGNDVDYATGSVGHMTWEDLIDLHTNGWGIAAHSVTHTRFYELTEAQQHYELSHTRECIQENMGITPRGWVFPVAGYTDTSIVERGWMYYSYVSTSYYDSFRFVGEPSGGNRTYRTDVIMPALTYGYHGFIDWYTHGISDDASYDVSLTAFSAMLEKLAARNAEVVVKDDYYEQYRNFRYAKVEGSADAFSVTYEREFGNPSISDYQIWLRISAEDGRYYLIDSTTGEIVRDDLMAAGGAVTVLVPPGTYELLTISEYRQRQLDESLSPLYAIIPVVVVLAVLGGLITMVGRLKF